MLTKAEFTRQVLNAYEHLYDLVYLRSHPLLEALAADAGPGAKEKAWHLHHTLLKAIGELDPGPEAPVSSHEWRRYQLATLRYVAGLSPQSVADQLAISRSTYYRDHDATIEAIAEILWARYCAQVEASSGLPAARGQNPASRRDLLLSEATRAAGGGGKAQVGTVLSGVLGLLASRLSERHLEAQVSLPSDLPSAVVDPSLLRQMLLGMLGHLIEHAERARVVVTASSEPQSLLLSLAVEPPEAVQPAPTEEIEKRVASLNDLAGLCGAGVEPRYPGRSLTGFAVRLPAGARRTVLVVDDNRDALELFRRYLIAQGYQAVTAQTAQEALTLARELQPYAITLDLMMPGQDGWDVLQTLLNQPGTRHIPVVVCSVLQERELALSLGAAAFLEKPVSGETLISTLDALEEA